jgi:hypothetical protein
MLPAPAHAQAQREVQQGPAPALPGTLRAAAPVDLTGTWVSIVTEDWRWRMMPPLRGDYAAVPLTAEGRRVADNWDPAADEANGQQCKFYGAAAVMRQPGRLAITWADDNTLQIRTDAGTQTRLLRFGTAAPAGERTWQGQTTALWELPPSAVPGGGGGGGRGRGGAKPSGALKAVTTNMRAGYLRKNGVPYSENATLTEYFVRVAGPANADWLVVTSIVEDPVYLTTPFVTSAHFKREADGSKFAPTPCVVPAE